MKNIYLFLLALVAVFGLSSCLKSLNSVNLGDIPGYKLFEIAPSENPALGAADRVYSVAYGISSTPQILKIPVYLNSTTGTFSSDVTVTLAKDTAAISAYNATDTTGATNFQFLPDSVYNSSVPLTVVIPAGQKFGYLTLNITSSKVNLFAQYMLSYKIVSVPTGSAISDTRTSVQYKVAIKNRYDGIFSDVFQLSGWGAYGIISDGMSHAWGSNVGIVTSGPNTVLKDYDLGGDYGQIGFTAGLGATSFGATKPQYTFDLATDKLTDVSNLTPDDGRGRKFKLNPAVTDSRYDATTGTIYAAYIMQQNGRPDQLIYDTLVYQKPR